jgi:hypothetical protein
MARHTTNLSSDDHYSEVDVLVGTAGAAARIQTADGSTVTGYVAEFSSSNFALLTKVVAGTRTQLDSGGNQGAGTPTMECRCDGSTISYYHNGDLMGSVTDTSITGNTGVGMQAITARTAGRSRVIGGGVI